MASPSVSTSQMPSQASSIKLASTEMVSCPRSQHKNNNVKQRAEGRMLRLKGRTHMYKFWLCNNQILGENLIMIFRPNEWGQRDRVGGLQTETHNTTRTLQFSATPMQRLL